MERNSSLVMIVQVRSMPDGRTLYDYQFREEGNEAQDEKDEMFENSNDSEGS
jgi:hypothetical protein